MKEESRQGTFAGVGEWIIERDGQEPTGNGGMVMVKVTTRLPLNYKFKCFDPRLDKRIMTLDERLVYDFGGTEDEYPLDYRTRSLWFQEDTWEKCFSAALDYISKQEAIVQKAIDKKK